MLYCDRTVVTDRHIRDHVSDIILIDKLKKTGLISDVAMPLTQNIRKTKNEKI